MSFPALELALRDAGLKSLSPEALEKFEAYLGLLMKWNSKLNLTAVRGPDAIVRRHFVECVQCAQALSGVPGAGATATLLDFGSGAGLPGIPIAICRPEIRVTLAESQGKKAAFLQETVRTLNLNAEVFGERVENMTPERRFGVVTLRAVDKMAEACRIAVARVERSGWIVLFATEKTKPTLKGALPEVDWQGRFSIYGSERGLILLGQRK